MTYLDSDRPSKTPADNRRPATILLTGLALGRVSNLPTIISNSVAAAILVNAGLRSEGQPILGVADITILALAMSLFYVGGMFLNDACDVEHDRRQQSFRPIPSGRASLLETLVGGSAMLLTGLSLVALVATGLAFDASRELLIRLAPSLALVLTILIYDRWHKGYPFAAWLMGMARALVYLSIAAVAGAMRVRPDGDFSSSLANVVSSPWLAGAASLGLYTVALTWVAKRLDQPAQRKAGETSTHSASLRPGHKAKYARNDAFRDSLPVEYLNLLIYLFMASILLWFQSTSTTWPFILVWLGFGAWVSSRLIQMKNADAQNRQAGGPHPVGMMIAAMCLLDAAWVSVIGDFSSALLLAALCPLTLLAQRFIRPS